MTRSMMRTPAHPSLRGVAVVATLTLGTALPASAQSSLDLEVRGGAAVPAGDLEEVGATGGGFGVGAAWHVSDRLALRVDGDLEVFSEERVGGARGVIMPRAYLWHYHAGLELDVLARETSPWRLRLRGGGGGTTYDTEVFFEGGDDFLDSYVSVNAGVLAGRRVGTSLEVGVIGQLFVVFTDRDRTAELADRSPVLNAFSKASSFPVQLYLRWTPR